MSVSEKQQNLMDIGATLRRARIAKDLRIDDIAEVTHINEKYLTLIEQGEFEELPSETFIRGFLRKYCRLVDISEDEIIVKFNSLKVNQNKQCSISTPGSRLLFWQWLPPGAKPSIGWVTMAVLIATFSMTLLWWGDGHTSNTILAGPLPDSENVNSELVESVTDLEIASQGMPSSSEHGSLKVDFTATSWIDVQDGAGSILFSGIKRAGGSLNLTNERQFKITIGNAAGVKLSYNSEPVNLASYSNDRNVAQLILGP